MFIVAIYSIRSFLGEWINCINLYLNTSYIRRYLLDTRTLCIYFRSNYSVCFFVRLNSCGTFSRAKRCWNGLWEGHTRLCSLSTGPALHYLWLHSGTACLPSPQTALLPPSLRIYSRCSNSTHLISILKGYKLY